MKFGIMLPHYRPVASTEAIAKMAKRAEELEFDSVWVTDLIAVPNIAYDRFGPIFYEATTVLSYVAGITNTVRLGGSVFALPFRNAIHMAKIAASIDALSHGRLILGVGVAGAQSEMLEMGVRDDGRGMKRGERADEALRIFQEVWTNDNPSVNTENYLISDFQMLPKPVQKPGIPIWVGGNSRRALRRTVEFGEVWNPARPTIDEVAAMAPRLKRMAEAAGRDPGELGIAPRIPTKIVSDESLCTEVNPLLGTAQQVIDNVGRFRDAGVTSFVIDTFSIPELYGETADDIYNTMERFAAEVVPHFRD